MISIYVGQGRSGTDPRSFLKYDSKVPKQGRPFCLVAGGLWVINYAEDEHEE